MCDSAQCRVLCDSAFLPRWLAPSQLELPLQLFDICSLQLRCNCYCLPGPSDFSFSMQPSSSDCEWVFSSGPHHLLHGHSWLSASSLAIFDTCPYVSICVGLRRGTGLHELLLRTCNPLSLSCYSVHYSLYELRNYWSILGHFRWGFPLPCLRIRWPFCSHSCCFSADYNWSHFLL